MPTLSGKSLIVMGIDVGTVNSAFGVSEYNPDKKSWKLIDAGMVPATLSNLKYDAEVKKKKRRGKAGANGEFDEVRLPSFRKQLKALLAWLDAMHEKFGFTALTIERFQSRGGVFGASMAEICAVIVGVVASWAAQHRVKIMLVTAADWKNRFTQAQKIKDMKEFYKKFRAKTCPPHMIDASLLGMYGGSKMFKQEPFSPFRHFHIDWMRSLYAKHGK